MNKHEFICPEFQTWENPINSGLDMNTKQGTPLKMMRKKTEWRTRTLSTESRCESVHPTKWIKEREGAMRTWVGECYYKLNNFIQWKNFLKTTGKYKQFGRNEAISWMYFPQRFSCFSLLTYYACHWRDKASLTWNKQGKKWPKSWLLQVETDSTSMESRHGKQLALGLFANLAKISPLSLILKTFQDDPHENECLLYWCEIQLGGISTCTETHSRNPGWPYFLPHCPSPLLDQSWIPWYTQTIRSTWRRDSCVSVDVWC